MSDVIKVCITGAAGQIAYSLVYMVARGEVFGFNQPIILTLLDIEPMMPQLDGLLMELQDCAFPTLKEVTKHCNPEEAFKDIDAALLVGAFPRKEGMERKDLLMRNCSIFKAQGAALDTVAKKSVKVVVVGNPANTNALICSHFAPSIPKANFTALTRLDMNRAKGLLAAFTGNTVDSVKNAIIWGNHSATQFPDVRHALINGKPCYGVINNDAWLKGDFISTVQQRGAAVIKARKASSAMSAAKAICDHMRDWWFGTDEIVSMGVISDKNSYGVPEGLIFSFPLKCKPDHSWEIVTGLEIDDFTRAKLDATAKELEGEKTMAFSNM